MSFPENWTVFETHLGHVGVVWRDDHICAMQLDEGGAEETASQLIERFPRAVQLRPTKQVTGLIIRIQKLFEGVSVDFTDVVLDWSLVSTFGRRVYQAARTIPAGEVRTYANVARAIGSPNASRAVGAALGRNPFPIVVPCHRVVSSNGGLGGFTCKSGVELKRRMLAAEGVNDLDRVSLPG